MANRVDDVSLGDRELLWRRILDRPMEWFTEEEDGTLRPSSAAFKDSTNEVSVNVASQTSLDAVMDGYGDQGLVSIPAGLPRSLNHIVAATVERDDPDDPSHRVICPPENLGKKQRMKAAKEMAKQATWVIHPHSCRTPSSDS